MDWIQTEFFLEVFGHTKPTFALFPPKKDVPKEKKFCIHHETYLEGKIPKSLIEKDLKKHPHLALGMVINPSKPRPSNWFNNPENQTSRGTVKAFGVANDHIQEAEWIWCEGDGGLSLEDQYQTIRESFLLPPNVCIWSGGKSLHAYWHLSKAIPPEKFRDWMQRLAEQVNKHNPAYQADKGLNNPSRVMRIPGGIHPQTGNRCHFRTADARTWGLELVESFLDSNPRNLQLEPSPQPNKLVSHRATKDEGWFSRRSSSEQHSLAVEMVSYLPRRNEEGRGEYPINISALYSLKGFFGESEAAQICSEANWFGTYWNPLDELPSVKNPSNSIGTLITLARQHGWELKEEDQKESTPKIRLEDIFPPEIVDPLRLVTKYLPYPDTLIATTYLASCSGLLKLGSTINLNPLSGFVVPLNLYVITVGCTGSKKSPLQKALIDGPIEKLKKSAKSEYQKILSDWFRADKDSRGPKPTPTYLVVQNVTEEALEMILVDHENKQKGLLYCRDEIKGIFNFDKYKSGKGSEQEQLLELYDGGGFTTIRKQERRICEKTHLSLYGGIQPPILAKLQGSSDHTGKWARVLFSPVPTNPVKLAVAISAEERKAFAAAKEKLSSLASDIRFSSGFQFELDDEAIRFFADYEFEKQKEAKAIASKRASHAAIKNKTAGKVGRIAGLLHHLNVITKRADVEDSVGIDVFEKAIRLVEFSDAFAMQFHTDNSRSEKEQLMKRFHNLALKSKSQKMTWTEMRNRLSGKERASLTPEMRQQVFEQLVEAHFGRLTEGPKGGLVYEALCDWPDDV